MARTHRAPQNLEPLAAPDVVRKPDVAPVVTLYSVKGEAQPTTPKFPSAQAQFTECTESGWTTEAWREWLTWCTATDYLRSAFWLGGDDESVPVVLRDFELTGMAYDDMLVRHGKKAASIQSDEEAFAIVTTWVVERGGLDLAKAREILDAAGLDERFAEVWPLAVRIAQEAAYMTPANVEHFPKLQARGADLWRQLREKGIL
jgi:hypothetical protein